MKCNAVLSGKVNRKGRPSVEWYKGEIPQYYCYGYIDNMTDELLPECKQCNKHIDQAQEDFESWNRRS